MATTDKPADNNERRVTYLTVELRSTPGEDGARSRHIGGYAAVFNSPSRLIPSRQGPFQERVLPTFFDRDNAARWPGPRENGVVCRYNHKDEFLLGATQSGTLQLRVDGRGLDYTVDVPRSREDVLEGVERRDIMASSFTFGLPDQGGDDWRYSEGVTQRTLVTGTLVDVAPVSALAAYPNANVALRSLAAFLDVPEEDVAAAAAQYELRRFFVLTDTPPATPPAQVAMEEAQRAIQERAQRDGAAAMQYGDQLVDTEQADTEQASAVPEPDPAADAPQLEPELEPPRMRGAAAKVHVLGRRPDFASSVSARQANLAPMKGNTK